MCLPSRLNEAAAASTKPQGACASGWIGAGGRRVVLQRGPAQIPPVDSLAFQSCGIALEERPDLRGAGETEHEHLRVGSAPEGLGKRPGHGFEGCRRRRQRQPCEDLILLEPQPMHDAIAVGIGSSHEHENVRLGGDDKRWRVERHAGRGAVRYPVSFDRRRGRNTY